MGGFPLCVYVYMHAVSWCGGSALSPSGCAARARARACTQGPLLSEEGQKAKVWVTRSRAPPAQEKKEVEEAYIYTSCAAEGLYQSEAQHVA